MPQRIFRIKWDEPDDVNWLAPHNVSNALHAFCPNTHFAVFEDVELEVIRGLYTSVCMNLHDFIKETGIKGRGGENVDELVIEAARQWKALAERQG